MLVSSRHLIGNAGGTGASSPRAPSTPPWGAKPEVLGVHGVPMPAEGLCPPRPHPLPGAMGSPEVSGYLLLPTPPASLPLPPATDFLFKDVSGRSSQYFCLLATAAASSLTINCLGWVAPWFSPIPAVSPLITHQNKPFKEEKKNSKGYFRQGQGQGQQVPLHGVGSWIWRKLPAAKRNSVPGHGRDLGGKSGLQRRGGGRGCRSSPWSAAQLRGGMLATQPVFQV